MVDGSSSLFQKNDVLLLKTINVLTKFLILWDNLLFNKFVSPKGYV